MLIKYRVHEVAKDFNLTSKDISEILTKYATTPKNHMQVLETPELDLIFESLTQKNQVENLEELLTAKPKEEPVKEKAEKKAAPSASEKGEKAAPAPQPTPAKEKKDKPHVPRKQAEKRVVDTRGSASINIDKYDEKFDNLASTILFCARISALNRDDYWTLRYLVDDPAYALGSNLDGVMSYLPLETIPKNYPENVSGGIGLVSVRSALEIPIAKWVCHYDIHNYFNPDASPIPVQ